MARNVHTSAATASTSRYIIGVVAASFDELWCHAEVGEPTRHDCISQLLSSTGLTDTVLPNLTPNF